MFLGLVWYAGVYFIYVKDCVLLLLLQNTFQFSTNFTMEYFAWRASIVISCESDG